MFAFVDPVPLVGNGVSFPSAVALGQHVSTPSFRTPSSAFTTRPVASSVLEVTVLERTV